MTEQRMGSRGAPRRSLGGALALAGTLAAGGCGGGAQLLELPLTTAHADRRALQRTVARSGTEAYTLYAGTGTGPDLLAWNGTALTSVDLPDAAQASSLALGGPGEVLVGGSQVLSVRGGAVTDISDQLSGAVSFVVASRGDGAVYAAGFGVLLRRAAGASTFEPLTAPAGGLYELVVAAPDRLFGISDGRSGDPDVILSFDGTTWRPASQGRTGRRLSAAAFDDAWALPLPGRTGAPLEVLSWNGMTWATVPVTISAAAMNNATPTISLLSVHALGAGRAGAVLTRKFESIPPRYEVVWVTGDRTGLATESVVRVYCQMARCTDGGDFTGIPDRAPDGTLFVGPYYGPVGR